MDKHHKAALRVELEIENSAPMWLYFGRDRLYGEWVDDDSCFRLRSEAGDGLPLDKLDESIKSLYEALPDRLVGFVRMRINAYRMDLL